MKFKNLAAYEIPAEALLTEMKILTQGKEHTPCQRLQLH